MVCSDLALCVEKLQKDHDYLLAERVRLKTKINRLVSKIQLFILTGENYV